MKEAKNLLCKRPNTFITTGLKNMKLKEVFMGSLRGTKWPWKGCQQRIDSKSTKNQKKWAKVRLFRLYCNLIESDSSTLDDNAQVLLDLISSRYMILKPDHLLFSKFCIEPEFIGSATFVEESIPFMDFHEMGYGTCP